MDQLDSPNYGDCDGFKIPGGFSPDAFRSAINYKPKPGQLFIVTYPKCGTLWLQHIVMLILRKGEPFGHLKELFWASPFIEMSGAETAANINGPSALKLHLPFNLTRFSREAKYIYIAKNPKDCCVSFYYHTKGFLSYNFKNGSFDKFFELFINGKTDYGDFFDHLIPWYNHRKEPNVHFLTYEDLKKNTKQEILKIAKFIGEEYYNSLKNDSKYMNNVLYYSSLEYMKKTRNDEFRNFYASPTDSEPIEQMPSGLRYFFTFLDKYFPEQSTGPANIVRKGQVGDWKSHLTPEQEERMEQWIEKKTKGSDVMNLWKDIFSQIQLLLID